jgi:hypothetical protein
LKVSGELAIGVVAIGALVYYFVIKPINDAESSAGDAVSSVINGVSNALTGVGDAIGEGLGAITTGFDGGLIPTTNSSGQGLE